MSRQRPVCFVAPRAPGFRTRAGSVGCSVTAQKLGAW